MQKPVEANCLAPVGGIVLILSELVRTILGALVAAKLFYLLIKLAGLADAMTKDRQTAGQTAASKAQS